MSTNGFREDELITRKVNGQTRVFPVVGGRLRLAHEGNEHLSLKTELISWDGTYAVFRCVATTDKGQFVGYGTANSQRDCRLSESLLELAETRSIARSLRFAGYGLEYCGAEEVSHVMETEPEKVFNDGNDGAQKSKASHDAIDRPTEGNGSKPQRCGTGQATTAQVRALHALIKKARYTEQDIQSILSPLEVDTFQQLTREDASRLISYLQTEVPA